ncbi:unnamed protein product [Gadus morhua 'NCC']
MCENAEFLSCVNTCWSESTVCEMKKLLKHFVVLQTHGHQGIVPETTTLEDMSSWLISRTCPNRQMPKLFPLTESWRTGETNQLKWCVYANLMQRTLELQASKEDPVNLNQAHKPMASGGLSSRCEEVHLEVVRGLRQVSPSVTFDPSASLHSPAEVLVDLVPRLLLNLQAQHRKALPRYQRGWLALTDVVLSAVLEVLDNLASALDNLETLKVYYSPATGVRLVHSVQRLMVKLQGSDERSLTGRMVDALTMKVQKMFQQSQDVILTEAVLDDLSDAKETVPERALYPPGPSSQQLILHAEELRTLVGLALVQIFDGRVEAQLDVSDWPIFDELENLLSHYNMRTSKKMEKVNWRLSPESIVRLSTELHNSLHSAFGSKLNLQMAVKHRVKVLTRSMNYRVVDLILQLQDRHLAESMAEESSGQFAMKVPVVEEIPTSPSCFSALWKVLRSSFTKRQAQKRGSSVEEEEWRDMVQTSIPQLYPSTWSYYCF